MRVIILSSIVLLSCSNSVMSAPQDLFGDMSPNRVYIERAKTIAYTALQAHNYLFDVALYSPRIIWWLTRYMVYPYVIRPAIDESLHMAYRYRWPLITSSGVSLATLICPFFLPFAFLRHLVPSWKHTGMFSLLLCIINMQAESIDHKLNNVQASIEEVEREIRYGFNDNKIRLNDVEQAMLNKVEVTRKELMDEFYKLNKLLQVLSDKVSTKEDADILKKDTVMIQNKIDMVLNILSRSK